MYGKKRTVDKKIGTLYKFIHTICIFVIKGTKLHFVN
jgi:hypothetical protein